MHTIRNATAFSLLVLSLVFAGACRGAQGDDESEPDKLVFKTKKGDVTYLHMKHSEREDKKCEVCHDAVFKKSTEEPLYYKPHKKAEKKKSSCATCHIKDGKAFAAKGNCKKCHEKKK